MVEHSPSASSGGESGLSNSGTEVILDADAAELARQLRLLPPVIDRAVAKEVWEAAWKDYVQASKKPEAMAERIPPSHDLMHRMCTL